MLLAGAKQTQMATELIHVTETFLIQLIAISVIRRDTILWNHGIRQGAKKHLGTCSIQRNNVSGPGLNLKPNCYRESLDGHPTSPWEGRCRCLPARNSGQTHSGKTALRYPVYSVLRNGPAGPEIGPHFGKEKTNPEPGRPSGGPMSVDSQKQSSRKPPRPIAARIHHCVT